MYESSRHPAFTLKSRKALYFLQQRHTFPPNSPIFWKKSPIFRQRALYVYVSTGIPLLLAYPIMPCVFRKRALHFRKRALYFRKRALYFRFRKRALYFFESTGIPLILVYPVMPYVFRKRALYFRKRALYFFESTGISIILASDIP